MYRRKNQRIIISTYNHNDLHFAVGFSENEKIVRISLPKKNLEEAVSEISNYHPKFSISDKYKDTVIEIATMYTGKPVNFNMDLLDMEISAEYEHETSTINTSFERQVILKVAKIQYGNIKTYKDIAKSINTHAYRAVGTAIGKNPFPIVVPCHRVVRSDGAVGGFRGGTEMKIKMLINEGLKPESGRIDIE